MTNNQGDEVIFFLGRDGNTSCLDVFTMFKAVPIICTVQMKSQMMFTQNVIKSSSSNQSPRIESDSQCRQIY